MPITLKPYYMYLTTPIRPYCFADKSPPRIGLPTSSGMDMRLIQGIIQQSACCGVKATIPRGGLPLKQQHVEYVRLISFLTFGFSLVLLFASLTSLPRGLAHHTVRPEHTGDPPCTPPVGKTQYDITGGTRPGGGMNLFHSFGDFNVPNNNIANFLNDSGLAPRPTSSVVSPGEISPTSLARSRPRLRECESLPDESGWLPVRSRTRTVNVGGMVSFTSADYLRVSRLCERIFNAVRRSQRMRY